MNLRSILAGALALAATSLPAVAGGISIEDGYLRVSGPMAKAAAGFMRIINHTNADDRLVAARAEFAAKIKTHTHIKGDDDVMMMREVEGGFVIPAGGEHVLERGGDHLMFMGLNRRLNEGDMVEIVLVFEKAGEIVVELPVNPPRSGAEAMPMGQGSSATGSGN